MLTTLIETNPRRSYLSRREPTQTVMPEDIEMRFEDWANNVDWFRPDAIDWVSQWYRPFHEAIC
jgi:hypothetical protein